MTTAKERARAEFRLMVKWIAVAAVLMVAGALYFLHSQGSLTIHMVVATVLGVAGALAQGIGLQPVVEQEVEGGTLGHDEKRFKSG